MSPELEKQLFVKYQGLYAFEDNDVESSDANQHVFAHGDGWFNIIDCLSATITDIVKSDKSRNHLTPKEFAETRQVRVRRVKEKFGKLRFYVDNGTLEIYAAISLAEDLSNRTCETCGSPGVPRAGAWIKVQCDSCEEKRKVKRNG